MRRDTIAKLTLGCLGIFMGGSMAGVGLANYVESGSFAFYKQRVPSTWDDAASAQVSLQSTDLAFASGRRDATAGAGAEEVFASFDP